MAEVSVGGVSFKGFGKISALFILASTIISGGWFGFKLWDQWLDLNETVSSIEKPDLSHYDTQLEVLKSEISTVLEEVSLVNDVASNLSKNINDDLKDLKQDIRAIDKVVNDIEDRVKEFLDANPHFRKGSLSGTGSQSSVEGKTVKPFNVQDLDMSKPEDRKKYAEYRKIRDSKPTQINLNNK